MCGVDQTVVNSIFKDTIFVDSSSTDVVTCNFRWGRVINLRLPFGSLFRYIKKLYQIIHGHYLNK